jgi:hypothetical protein
MTFPNQHSNKLFSLLLLRIEIKTGTKILACGQILKFFSLSNHMLLFVDFFVNQFRKARRRNYECESHCRKERLAKKWKRDEKFE